MSQSYPGPQQQPYPPQQPYSPHESYAPQQPGRTPAWGQPQHPGPYGGPPPLPPRKGLSTGATVGLSVGGVLVLLVVLGALVKGGDGTSDGKAGAAAPTKSSALGGALPEEKAPVTVTAVKTAFKPSVLHGGGKYTSVKVTVANNGEKKIDVNPLYFTITDTDGVKHVAELGMDEGQIATVELEPGEKVTGTVTSGGEFTAQYVTYVDGLFGKGVRGDVS
ncbi:DUF4352 domain-containing protein [Streptomyces sp. NPDC053755]|uniref:DUF4352 domain-containing protein n=1 Tax=Streptomyces sp. NPDC053755 TaxID=3155815 RepID=UPI0034473117